MNKTISAAAVSLILSACAGSSTPVEANEASTATAALTAENGGTLNGGTLNGGTLNGGTLNGGTLNGANLNQMIVNVDFDNVLLQGSARLDSATLEGTTFVGYRSGVRFAGADFLQAEFKGNLGDGVTKVRLRVRSIAPGASPNTDLSTYSVEFRSDDQNWYPLCRDAAGNPTTALPVTGYWDYRTGVPTGGAKLEDPTKFTFACQGGAIAKCVNLGYRPWTTYQGESLAAYHQTCTRLIRADYCGTGTPYTQNGNVINLYDTLGIQEDTEEWVFEAEWDENGARCFYPLNQSREGIPCYDDRVEALCGQQVSATRGVRFTNETPTAGLTPGPAL